MIEAALSEIVEAAVARAVAPLAAEVRELRATVAASSSRWLSRIEAARALGVSTDTVDRRLADGSLRGRRLGRAVRVLVVEAPVTDEQIDELARAARRGGA